jgi:hypothetical protein
VDRVNRVVRAFRSAAQISSAILTSSQALSPAQRSRIHV